MSRNELFQGQLTDSITFLWFLYTVSLALWRRAPAAPAWLLMPSPWAEKLIRVRVNRGVVVSFPCAQFLANVRV